MGVMLLHGRRVRVMSPSLMVDWISARLHWLFLVIAGGFGLALVFATPPNGSSDEISHEVKVVRVASGNLFGADRSTLLPDIKGWHGAFTDLAMLDGQRRFGKTELNATLNAPLACTPVTLVANDTVTSYGPLPYLLPALIYRASCLVGARYGSYLRAARIAGLSVALALICVGIASAGPGRWGLFGVAVLPDTVGQLVAISADAMLFGLCLALLGFVSGILSRRIEPTPGLALLLLSGVAIALTKPGYFWFPWVALVTLPVYWEAGWSWRRLALLFLGLPVIVQAGLIGLSQGSLPVVTGVHPDEQLHLLRVDPLHFLSQLTNLPAAAPIGTQWSVLDTLVGLPVWMDTRLPPWLSVALYGGLVLAMGMESNPRLSGRTRVFLAGLAGLSIVFIVLPLYVFATPTESRAIFGVQGRYFIPTLAVLVMAGCFAMPGRASTRAGTRTSTRTLGAVLLLALPCVALAQTRMLVHWRYFG